MAADLLMMAMVDKLNHQFSAFFLKTITGINSLKLVGMVFDMLFERFLF